MTAAWPPAAGFVPTQPGSIVGQGPPGPPGPQGPNWQVGTGLGLNPGTTPSTVYLANTAVTAGSYTYSSITVDAQGRLTAASSGTAPPPGTVTSITAGAGITLTPATITGTGSIALTTPVTIANGGTNATSLPVPANPGWGVTTALLQTNGSVVAPEAGTNGLVGTWGGGNLVFVQSNVIANNLYIQTAASRGTLAVPTALQAADWMFSLSCSGYGTTAYSSTDRANIRAIAAENWSNTAQGTYWRFETTQPTTVTTAERVRIGQGLMVGTTTDSGAGNVNVSGGYYINNVPLGTISTQNANAVAITGGTVNGTSIGATTASTGAFTTLSASGTVSGAGFTTLLAPYALLASPTFTGTPAAPTATAGTSTTQLATTAFVATSFAPLASPTFTGTPNLPTGTVGVTQAAATNNTTLATTAYVKSQNYVTGGPYLPLTGGTLSGSLAVNSNANPTLAAGVAGTYTGLYAPDGTGTSSGIFLSTVAGGGNAYYRDTLHTFQDPTGVTYVSIASNGLVVGSPTGGAKGAGTINATTVYAGGVALTSDARVKRDIGLLPDDCLKLVGLIAPKQFRFIEPPQPQPSGPQDYPSRHPVEMGPPGWFERKHWGFIAQDVRAAMADYEFGGVEEDAAGNLALSPSDMAAVLWKAVQELAARVAALE